MTKRSFIHAGLIILLLQMAVANGAMVPTPDEITQAAQDGLKRFMALDLSTCGIPTNITPQQVTLSRPFRLFKITPQALAACRTGATVTDMAEPTDQHYLLAQITERTICLLVIDRVEGQWRAVSLGCPDFAVELARVLAAWPEAKGYHPQFIVMRQAGQILFTIPEQGPANLTPVQMPKKAPQTAAIATIPDYTRLADLSATVTDLSARVAQNMAIPCDGGK